MTGWRTKEQDYNNDEGTGRLFIQFVGLIFVLFRIREIHLIYSANKMIPVYEYMYVTHYALYVLGPT